ncbi:MAG: hypothetical protein LBR42_02265, partial [Candidatus Methanoplasma sp.]|nr:hypothetical protein [Candidatus Methanoplasma sp.]
MPSEGSESTRCSVARSFMNCSSPEFDIGRAAEILEKLASDGDDEAQYLYSLFLLTGTSVLQDKVAAKELLTISAASGNEDAAQMLKEIEAGADSSEVIGLASLKLKGEQRNTDAC